VSIPIEEMDWVRNGAGLLETDNILISSGITSYSLLEFFCLTTFPLIAIEECSFKLFNDSKIFSLNNDKGKRNNVLAVKNVNLSIEEGQFVCFVGPSGCGKSTAAMGILQLVVPPGRIADGEVLLEGQNILGLPEKALRSVRWIKLALIPQGAMNSLNPTMKVSDQIKDVIVAHEGKRSKQDLKDRVLELLSMVGLPGRVYDLYPHELSGGMKQRACIAMAIALNPTIIIADESTSEPGLIDAGHVHRM